MMMFQLYCGLLIKCNIDIKLPLVAAHSFLNVLVDFTLFVKVIITSEVIFKRSDI